MFVSLRILVGLLIVTFYAVHNVVSQKCEERGISYFAKEGSANKMRYTTIQDGNYSVQALVTFTSGADNCKDVNKDGLVKIYAIQYAIEKANEKLQSRFGAKLGLQLDDVCRSLPVTMARGIEVVSLHRPNSVCRADFLKCASGATIDKTAVKKATAVIGTQMSFTTIPLASLMSLYYIPQVSHAASSRLLSKRELYKSFFRTIPSDTKQINVMLDIIKSFDWNYVFAVGSDDDYGKLGVSDLKREAEKRNVCIPHDEYIPYQSVKTLEKVKEVVTKIKNQDKAKVVVLFCYVNGLGDKIMEEAKNQNVKRFWLTSEAWNPIAKTLDPVDLKNQTEGLLSVSLKAYKMPKFLAHMRKKVSTDVKCNMWLQKYLENHHECTGEFSNVNDTDIKCGDKIVKVDKIMKQLSILPGKTDNLINSATALGMAVEKVLENECPKGDASKSCSIAELEPKKVTMEMFNVSFTDEETGQLISFDSVGDPMSAFYTVENLQIIDGKHEYVPVGNWTQIEGEIGNLQLNRSAIVWPSWWMEPGDPTSKCSKDCQKGTYVVGRSGCCWACLKCSGNNYSDQAMMTACKDCGNYSHTLDNIRCIKTPMLWLEITDPAGMSITIISALGFLIVCITSGFLMKLRKMIIPNDPAPHLVGVSCAVLLVTFVFGPLHVLEPTDVLCHVRNGIFFMMLMMYSAILLTRSKFMTAYLQKHAERTFRGNLMAAQCVFLVLMFLLELTSIIAWIYIDKKKIEEFRQVGVNEIWKQCEVSFTAARLVSTFIPCIILIIATFCAFRERNLEHSFYEPKFLSFTCIALCIIIVAFLPTFKYVVGIYKAIVMAFTMDVFAYTFMACLVLPRLYVGVMRNKRGVGEYPMKPGTASKKSEKDKVKEIRSQTSMQSSTNERTESSAIETSMTKTRTGSSIGNGDISVSQPNDVKLDERDEEGIEEKEVNGYNNHMYDKTQDQDTDSVYGNSSVSSNSEKPPPYEEVSKDEK